MKDVTAVAQAGKLEELPGIGKDLAAMIEEYIRTRCVSRYERERRGIPDGLIDLMSVPGLGPKTLALVHRDLGVNSLEDLQRAIDTKALLKVKGFGARKIENLSQIDPFQQQAQFPSGDLLAPRLSKRKLKRAHLQPLVPDGPPVPVPVQNLQPVAAPVAEHQQVPGKRIAAQTSCSLAAWRFAAEQPYISCT